MTVLMLVTATLLSLGGAVFCVLDGSMATRRARNRRLSATFLAVSGTALVAALVWAVAGWSTA